MKDIFKYTLIFLTIIVAVVLLTSRFYHLPESKKSKDFSLAVIKKDTFWIYEISQNDKLLIRQEYIPAVLGTQVFSSEKDAEAIGTIVLNKLRSYQIPRVTIEEIKSNNVKFKDI